MLILSALKTVIRELPEDIRRFGLTPQDMMRFVHKAQALLSLDRLAYLKDPATRDAALIDGVNCGFQAVAFFRVAHEIQRYGEETDLAGCGILARMLSERGKVLTGVEIHPSAQIGPGLVIDHGFCSVVGETVTAGSRLYMLHAVTLGAAAIVGSPAGRRHPQLGDDVRIGAHVSIFGPVQIGNGADIGSGCLIATDVPDRAKVSQQLIYQVMRDREVGTAGAPAEVDDFPEIYGMVPVLGPGPIAVRILGRSLTPIAAALIDRRGAPLAGYTDLETKLVAPDAVEIELVHSPSLAIEEERKIGLRLGLSNGSEMILTGRGLTRVLHKLKSSGAGLEGK
jgi:serine O-acetyltransferase